LAVLLGVWLGWDSENKCNEYQRWRWSGGGESHDFVFRHREEASDRHKTTQWIHDPLPHVIISRGDSVCAFRLYLIIACE
jgi:hypothetical protein